jgi:hypothetical protein
MLWLVAAELLPEALDEARLGAVALIVAVSAAAMIAFQTLL